MPPITIIYMTTVKITTTYPAPSQGPAGLAWDGRWLWNADYTAGSIFQIDPTTGQQTGKLICPGNLSGLTWNGHALWQSLHDAGWLRRINPTTNDFDQTIIVHKHGWLSGIAWDGQNLWAASQQHGKLFRLDQESGDVIGTIPAPVAGGGLDFYQGALWLGVAYPMHFNKEQLYFDWDDERRNFAVLQIDPKNGREIAHHPLDFLPMGLAWVNDTLWLTHTATRKLYCAEIN